MEIDLSDCRDGCEHNDIGFVEISQIPVTQDAFFFIIISFDRV